MSADEQPVCPDVDYDQLRAVADSIRARAEDSAYGAFHGGDPHDFHPDVEVCSAEEIEAHAAACLAWDSGVRADDEPVCNAGAFGVGVYTFRDDVIVKLAQELDDWIDRARQAGL